MSKSASPGVEAYRAVTAQVAFQPHEFQVFQRRVRYGRQLAKAAGTYAATAEAFLEATEELGGLLPKFFPFVPIPGRPQRPGSKPAETGSPRVNSTPLDDIRVAADAIGTRLKAEHGVVRPYSLTDILPEAATVECDITVPRRRAVNDIWLDAVSTVAPVAVLAGYSHKSVHGNTIPTRQFATVIDSRQRDQQARLYYGPDGIEGRDDFFEAVVATLPQPSETPSA